MHEVLIINVNKGMKKKGIKEEINI